MRTLQAVLGLSMAIVLSGVTAAKAQDPFLGKQEFLQRCAVCHGAEGAGDGPVGELFAIKPRDLRTLARENGGTYPFARIYATIDGRDRIPGHGGPEMPIWGDFLEAEALVEDRGISPEDAQMIASARIIALTQYIGSLQLK
ncbi:c-type cytochrome [Aestuariicoccus sp. MJ-SS9]|uniref:c-type cytochrome n=1 Tax=Aestuariicoccus sp. MJ-SS9 TaxID=3079855 RepID=UPI0029144E3E|nr:c-type cytochrome [Aestuariicoccus sp. MJ-SS9]MDU8911256.1 c-type cytochrome [Aestuariicoccus sp. MJ-SS9]